MPVSNTTQTTEGPSERDRWLVSRSKRKENSCRQLRNGARAEEEIRRIALIVRGPFLVVFFEFWPVDGSRHNARWGRASIILGGVGPFKTDAAGEREGKCSSKHNSRGLKSQVLRFERERERAADDHRCRGIPPPVLMPCRLAI